MKLLKKDAEILIVDPVSSVSNTIKRVLQEKGYKKIHVADSVLDGLNTLGTNAIDWILTSLFEDEKFNAWHFLRIPLELEGYRQVMTSVLLNEEQERYLPSLYAMGLLSFHKRPLTYNSFKEECNALTAQLQEALHPTLAVAANLRQRFQAKGQIDELERLEAGLYNTLDSTATQKIRLIQAQLEAGNNLEALIGMKQLLQKDPQLKEQVNALGSKYLEIPDIQEYKTKLNVHLVLVVDPDEAQQNFIVDSLEELGIKEVKAVSSPKEACEFLDHHPAIDLLVTEWKLPDIGGRGLVQFAKQGPLKDKPVLIYSALVDETDEKLTDEIGGVFQVNKPQSRKAFKEAVSDVFSRWRFPLEAEDLEQKIRVCLERGEFEYGRQLLLQFEAREGVDKSRKIIMRATCAFFAGQYREAKALIIEASKICLPTHKEIGLLGKVLLKLGEFVDARKCLEQAHSMVPCNIDRLLALADVCAELGATADVGRYLSEAKDVGGESPLVMAAAARHAVLAGRTEEAQAYLDDESLARGVIAYMNNLGVAYAASGQWRESTNAYLKAIKSLGEKHNDLQGIVSYNLGLSLARQGRLNESLPQLQHAQEKAPPLVSKKAARLTEKVQHARDTHSELQLHEAPKELVASMPGIGQEFATTIQGYVSSHQKPDHIGDHGLFGIYVPSQELELDLTVEFPRNLKKSV